MRLQRADGTKTMVLMGYMWANTARANGPAARESKRVYTGSGQLESTRSDTCTGTRNDDKGQDETPILAAGHLDTISIMGESSRAILLHSPSGDLCRDAGYLRAPRLKPCEISQQHSPRSAAA